VQLCRAAERTRRIGLGPGVLIPGLRHPMVNAAAIATLVSIAGPGRIAVGIGSGFTGRPRASSLFAPLPSPWTGSFSSEFRQSVIRAWRVPNAKTIKDFQRVSQRRRH
jgi:alkanesulfonate monooxygenase SsuD/methylene tetrahydromethanopterin reductase-like flavin-dependent oxidoreductase (luciferase family)